MFEIKLSEKQKAIYKDLSKNVSIKNGSSMESIRELVRICVSNVNNKKAEVNAKINENNDNLSKRLADEANNKLQEEFKQYTDDMITILSRRCAEFFDAKRNTVTKFIKNMPSDALWKKLQFIKDFGDLLDKEEWEVFITDPDIASNYYASKIIQKEAERHGIDYVIALNYNRLMDKINDIEIMVNNSIPHIADSQNSLNLLSFISENANSPVSQLIADIDTDLASIIPADRLTVLQRLKNAKQTAYDKNNVKLSVKIGSFIDRNIDKLATPEEINESLYAEAEKFIEQGMNAEKE